MKKYQCYYNETIFCNGRSYKGERVNTEIFDTEEEAEDYCDRIVGISDFEGDEDSVDCEVLHDGMGSYIEHEMFYDEIEV